MNTRHFDHDGLYCGPEDDVPYCPICDCQMEWFDCAICYGEGHIDLNDAYPSLYAPGELETCDGCKGKGGWLACPNQPHAKEVA